MHDCGIQCLEFNPLPIHSSKLYLVSYHVLESKRERVLYEDTGIEPQCVKRALRWLLKWLKRYLAHEVYNTVRRPSAYRYNKRTLVYVRLNRLAEKKVAFTRPRRLKS